MSVTVTLLNGIQLPNAEVVRLSELVGINAKLADEVRPFLVGAGDACADPTGEGEAIALTDVYGADIKVVLSGSRVAPLSSVLYVEVIETATQQSNRNII